MQLPSLQELFHFAFLECERQFPFADFQGTVVVIHALSKLHSGGKLVGVISHVSNLADEIPCVISVTKNGGGKSTLSGPGVTQK